MRYVKIVILVSFLFVFLGCATIISQIDDHTTKEINYDFLVPRIYSGSIIDVHGLTADNLGIFALVDLPLSFTLDTILLPYTFVRQIKFGNIESDRKK